MSKADGKVKAYMSRMKKKFQEEKERMADSRGSKKGKKGKNGAVIVQTSNGEQSTVVKVVGGQKTTEVYDKNGKLVDRKVEKVENNGNTIILSNNVSGSTVQVGSVAGKGGKGGKASHGKKHNHHNGKKHDEKKDDKSKSDEKKKDGEKGEVKKETKGPFTSLVEKIESKISRKLAWILSCSMMLVTCVLVK